MGGGLGSSVPLRESGITVEERFGGEVKSSDLERSLQAYLGRGRCGAHLPLSM